MSARNVTALKMSKWQAWLLATRPKTLTASIIPVAAATTLSDGSLWIAFFALLTAICIQIGANLFNDVLDFKKGADTVHRIGPMRVTQSGLLSESEVLFGGIIFFLMSLLFGIPLIIQGGWPIVLLLIASLICGYLYTGGPFPLAYCGLGELFVLLFYGFASTAAVYYLNTGYVDATAILAGAQIGLLATAIIAMNNFRDHQQDAQAQKMTLAVRFGITFARVEVTLLVLLPFFLNLLWLEYDRELAAFLPLLSLPLASTILYNIWTTKPGPIYNQFFAQTALLHLVFGLLLTVGL